MLQKFTFILLLISGLAFASYQAKVSANTLNVRNNSSTTSKVLFKLNKNDEITVYSCQNGFCEIFANNRTGFVSEKYIKRIENRQPASSGSKTTLFSDEAARCLWLIGILILLLILTFVLKRFKAPLKIFLSFLFVTIAVFLSGLMIYGKSFLVGFLVLFVGLDIVCLIIYGGIQSIIYRFSPEGRKAAAEERRIEELVEKAIEKKRRGH
ncbi:MAG: SH3 domain-containing protein [Fibrobacter sp.]|uniref:SH3 domain-containing protein n=1 Tax=Fibrobacter sp. TaxID=35828 RepID=UPI002A9177C2|nr:SH3 domain-containing protein [Fibrobacter sp.]MDY6264941.1 SH3 domain-containing protein [Fibrobacter sp.]